MNFSLVSSWYKCLFLKSKNNSVDGYCKVTQIELLRDEYPALSCVADLTNQCGNKKMDQSS